VIDQSIADEHRLHQRVVVIDPHPLFRAAIAEICTRQTTPRLEITKSVGTGREGEAAIRALRPDLAILELDLPDVRGLSLLRRLSSGVATRFVVLTSQDDGASVYAAFASGAAAYLTKAADGAQIWTALRAVVEGDTVISPELHRFVAAEIRLQGIGRQIVLTPRERDVLALVAEGCSALEIGQRLYVSHSTVKSHLGNIYEKLGVSDRAAAVAQAMGRGLVEIPG
jgi:two-component system nitrate/nitrite response regulator NarL